MTAAKFSIVPLRDCTRAIECLATWHYQQWGAWNPANDVARRIERFQQHCSRDHIPTTFVALAGDSPEHGEVVGSASAVVADLDSHEHLSPWLASVFVAPNFRRRGVGSQLVQAVTAEVARLGYLCIYLFTPDQQKLYQQLGWQAIEECRWGETPVTIMQMPLANSDIRKR